MEYSVLFVLIIGVIVLASSFVNDHIKRKQAHEERMELLKLIKAQNLTEYTSMDQNKLQSKENNNFIRKAMKNAYGEDEDS